MVYRQSLEIERRLATVLRLIRTGRYSTPGLAEQYLKWRGGRDEFLGALERRDPEATARGWQRDYMKGLLPDGGRAPAHQTRVHLKEFAGA